MGEVEIVPWGVVGLDPASEPAVDALRDAIVPICKQKKKDYIQANSMLANKKSAYTKTPSFEKDI